MLRLRLPAGQVDNRMKSPTPGVVADWPTGRHQDLPKVDYRRTPDVVAVAYTARFGTGRDQALSGRVPWSRYRNGRVRQ